MKPKSADDAALFASMVADRQGWVLNPDEEFRRVLIEGLATNWNRYGYFLCPCRDTELSREADADVICPCRYSWDDIRERGHCYCALFLSRSFADSGDQPSGIPDRRGL